MKAGAEDRVDDHRSTVERLGGEPPRRLAGQTLKVDAGISRELLVCHEQQHVNLAAASTQPSRRDEPVAAVVARAADDRDPAAHASPLDELGQSTAGSLHQLRRRDLQVLDRPGVDRALLGGIGQRRDPGGQFGHHVSIIATAPAWPRVWVSESFTLRTPSAAARSATVPCSATVGAPPSETTSTSRHSQWLSPSALATASLAQNRAARC
jgi:hypothetical protein